MHIEYFDKEYKTINDTPAQCCAPDYCSWHCLLRAVYEGEIQRSKAMVVKDRFDVRMGWGLYHIRFPGIPNGLLFEQSRHTEPEKELWDDYLRRRVKDLRFYCYEGESAVAAHQLQDMPNLESMSLRTNLGDFSLGLAEQIVEKHPKLKDVEIYESYFREKDSQGLYMLASAAKDLPFKVIFNQCTFEDPAQEELIHRVFK